ncbi:Tight junction protein ZO-1 [Nymphon striatum]|nr:Tight junction protein ZO-1 [Nymphon striatum]
MDAAISPLFDVIHPCKAWSTSRSFALDLCKHHDFLHIIMPDYMTEVLCLSTFDSVSGYGFGIAVSGGRDNPHFMNGDPAIAISDVLRAGPAEGKLQVNDRVISANRVSLENVDYATAVQVLRDSGASVELVNFGLVLGCKIYIKEVANKNLVERDGNIYDGDIITKINNTSTDSMTLKEAKKMIENCKEKLHLVLRRDNVKSTNTENLQNTYDGANHNKDQNFVDVTSDNRQNWANQNLYVQPPTRGDHRRQPTSGNDEKNNLSNESARLSTGRSRGPLMDISLSQLDQPATPLLHGHGHSRGAIGIDEEEPPPRPPPPRSEDYLGRRDLYSDDPLASRNKVPQPDPRFISFQKEGSVGIRLTGGNEVGIFVTAVQPGSPASLQGLQPGDRLIKVNEKEMRGVTREEAVLYLLSLQDQIHLIVQYRKEEYDTIVATQKGDAFHIRTHFTYDTVSKGEMSFHTGDVFNVIDTLYNGVVGAWQVYRMGRHNQETQKGIIPNKSRAEELAQAQQSRAKKDASSSESRGSFFKRRSARRSKSLCKDHWDDVVFSDAISKFSAYERVTLKHPGFTRPIVLFGPLNDVIRDRLLRDGPDMFASPQLDNNLGDVPKSQKSSGIVRLSAIKEIIDKGKHAVLDITPNAVDRLNYAQFYPIVIFLRADNKHIIKELRNRHAKSSHKSSKKLYDHSVKIERLWSHIFTATIALTSGDTWYHKIKDVIEKQQHSEIWMSEAKPEENISDDFLFPMTSRLSYASSPESDLDLTCDSRPTSMHERDSSTSRALQNHARLVKASSDPSIATQEDINQSVNGGIPNYNQPPPYSINPHRQEQARIQDEEEDAGRRESLAQKRSPENGVYAPYYAHEANNYNYKAQMNGASPNRYGVMNGEPPGDEGPEPYSPKPRVHPTSNEHPDLPPPPPKIDRASKPTQFRSAQEMLFGNQNGRPEEPDHGSSNYINASPNKSVSLDREAKPPGQVGYDSSSFSSDSYNKHNGNHQKQASVNHDDRRKPRDPRYASHSRAMSYENYNSSKMHDPYRFTRSTTQPMGMPRSAEKPRHPDMPPQQKYRSPQEEMRPVPPPKPASYQPRLPDGKPVPPPKPNNYKSTTMERQSRRSNSEVYNNNYPQSPLSSPDGMSPPYHKRSSRDGEYNQSLYYTPTKSHPPPPVSYMESKYAHHNNFNKYEHHEMNNGFDSGHGTGSSVDRHNFMAQMTTPTRSNANHSSHHYNNSHSSPESSGLLDLSNRENRGSAFELYRKPDSSRLAMSPSHNYQAVGYATDGMKLSSFLYIIPKRSNSSSLELELDLAFPKKETAGLSVLRRLSVGSVDSSGNCVIAKAKGKFTCKGGALVSEETGVSLHIPPGALPEGTDQEIYFKVCQDGSMVPPLDTDKGETLLSPLVMCGPHGLTFNKPVELRLPHIPELNSESWSLALKSTEAEDGSSRRWKNITLGDRDVSAEEHKHSNFIVVPVDHF